MDDANYRHHLQAAAWSSSTSTRWASSPRDNSSFDDDLLARAMFADRILGEDQAFLRNAVDEADAYTQVGIEVLHLLRYICVNAMATRKILKKHDKLLSKISSSPAQRDQSRRDAHRLAGGADAHMRAMCNSYGISAVTASLRAALAEFQTAHRRAAALRVRAAMPPTAEAGGYHSLRGGSAASGNNTGTTHEHGEAPRATEGTGGGRGQAGAAAAAADKAAAEDLLQSSAPITRLHNTISSIQTVRLATETRAGD